MSFSARVPAELLCEIVTYFSPDSDLETFQQLALTGRYFHHLSRPALFRSFKFYPYSMANDLDGLSPGLIPVLSASEYDRGRQRLEFWASQAIAPYVLRCEVGPQFPNSSLPTEEDPYTLLGTFFDFLPRFTNLQTILGFLVNFTSTVMTSLQVLPNLRSVTLEASHPAVGVLELEVVKPKSLKLDVLRLYNNNESLNTWWFQALCPKTLHSSAPCFPNVETFTLGLQTLEAPLGLVPLSKFPAVKHLTLNLKRWNTDGFSIETSPPKADGIGLCPLLIDYSGPYHILPLLHLSSLRYLTIDICNLDAFLITMSSISKPNNIESLTMGLNRSVPSLGCLSDFFPSLKTLLLTVYGPSPSAYMLLDELPTSLPPKIVRLAINWRFNEAMVHSLPKLKDDIVSRRPTLKTLWIHCPGFVYVWAKMPDGHHSTIIGGTRAAARIFPDFKRIFYGYWRTQEFDTEEDDCESASDLDCSCSDLGSNE